MYSLVHNRQYNAMSKLSDNFGKNNITLRHLGNSATCMDSKKIILMNTLCKQWVALFCNWSGLYHFQQNCLNTVFFSCKKQNRYKRRQINNTYSKYCVFLFLKIATAESNLFLISQTCSTGSQTNLFSSFPGNHYIFRGSNHQVSMRQQT